MKTLRTRQTKPRTVLATISDARCMLRGLDEDGVKWLLEEGHLAFAWNIGLGWITVPRILPDCLRHYARTQGREPYPHTEEEVLASLLDFGTPHVTSTQLRLLLNCGAAHVTNLVVERQLALVPGTRYGRGRNGAARITKESLRQFFTSRRLPR
jgi:hypothetical protein